MWHPAVAPTVCLNMFQDCGVCCEKVPVRTSGFVLARMSMPLSSSRMFESIQWVCGIQEKKENIIIIFFLPARLSSVCDW